MSVETSIPTKNSKERQQVMVQNMYILKGTVPTFLEKTENAHKKK